MSTNSLRVFLQFTDKRIFVGRLALSNRRIFFEYDADFLTTGLSISPFELALSVCVKSCVDPMFEGLYGVFSDSLPDGWGRLLLDRHLRATGISPATLTPLDRLAYVGQHGMGALCYEPEHAQSLAQPNTINLDQLAQESQQVLASDANLFFDDLLFLTGSSGGARPKILALVSADKKQLQIDHGKLPQGFNHWLIKFAASADPYDVGAIEFAYHHMAHAAGVETTAAHLFTTSKHAYFGTQRFDRVGNERLHLHSLCGLINADHRIPSLDYETVLKVTQLLTKDITEVKKAFRLAVFNVLAHNRDDHSKNFSFLMSADGQWRLAPAYDLLFSDGPGGEQSTTVMGEGKNPSAEHLLKLAQKFALHDAKEIIADVQAAIAKWPTFAKNAEVSRTSLQQIQSEIC